MEKESEEKRLSVKQSDLDELSFFNPWDWQDEEVTRKIELPIEPKKTFCQHLWLSYTGLNEVYQYCKYCGEKDR